METSRGYVAFLGLASHPHLYQATKVNILLDDSGHARIADFGLSVVTQNLDSMLSTSLHRGNAARWTAPEVLKGGVYSKEADVFAFAMVMIEVRYG